MSRPKGSKNKNTSYKTDNKILTKVDVRAKNEEYVKPSSYEEGNFIPVKIIFYFDWKCPKCKKLNLQRFANIYHVDGPAWCGVGVTCNQCNTHFNILEDDEGGEPEPVERSA